MGKAVGAVASGGLSLLAPKLGIGLDDEQGAYATPEQKRQQDYQKFLDDYGSNVGGAEKKVQYGQFTGGLFNPETGLQSQVEKEGRDLASQGFQLAPEDREAYGQASGDVARMFGQQEQDLSKSLARRGLASAGSGAAGAGFSGLQGSKNEMLAKAQTNIANQRMQNTQQRLMQNRQLQQNLAQQGTDLRQGEYEGMRRSLAGSAGAEQGLNNENQQTMAAQQAAIKPGLFSTIGQGLQRGIGQLAQAGPGMAVGGVGGGMASSGMGSQSGLAADRAGGTTGLSRDYLSMRER